MSLDIFIEKEKKSLPQYEAPLPRQTHQEVCEEGRSARFHDAGTHGQAHAHPLQFLQRLKDKSGHTNVFLHHVDGIIASTCSARVGHRVFPARFI